MEYIDIESIDLSFVFLHFTNQSNLESIRKKGLLPAIGANAKGAELTEKIFFSSGSTGTLQIFNVWIKWLIKKYQSELYVKDAKTKEEWYDKHNKYNEDFLNGKIFQSDKVKEIVFDYMYNYMSQNCYLLLDLIEGQDYKISDIDEAKIRSNQKGSRKYLNVLYGINENTSTNMEPWNMHTISGKIIPPNQIKILCVNGKIDSISIIKEIYEKTNRENLDLRLLDEFLEYIKILEKDVKDTSSLK